MNSAEAEQAEFMKKVLSGVTLVSLPVASTMPVSVLVFDREQLLLAWLHDSHLAPADTGDARSAAEAWSICGRNRGSFQGGAPAPPHDTATVQRAQLSAAETLEELARTFAEQGSSPRPSACSAARWSCVDGAATSAR